MRKIITKGGFVKVFEKLKKSVCTVLDLLTDNENIRYENKYLKDENAVLRDIFNSLSKKNTILSNYIRSLGKDLPPGGD